MIELKWPSIWSLLKCLYSDLWFHRVADRTWRISFWIHWQREFEKEINVNPIVAEKNELIENSLEIE